MSFRLIVIPLAILTALALALVAFQIGHAPPAVVASELAPAPAPAPLMLNILVAARAVPPGTLVRDEDFVSKPVSQRQMTETSVQDTAQIRGELRGSLVRRFLEEGAPLNRADLLRPRDRGFLAAVLEPGTRAVSIGVDAVTGVSGLIWPGNRVDVILTQEIDAQNVPLAHRVFGETVLTDVRVIAVDQQITEGGVPANGNEGVGKLARTVTLQVASDQAERVSVAGRMGHLALAVRAIEETPASAAIAAAAAATPAGPTVFGSDVSPELSASTRRRGQIMQLIQGEHREQVTFQ